MIHTIVTFIIGTLLAFPVADMNQYLNDRGSAELKGTGNIWMHYGLEYGIKPQFGLCVATADTSLGKALTWSYNYGNVLGCGIGLPTNNCQSRSQGIEAIFKTLSKKNGNFEDLSCYGGCHYPVYATSGANGTEPNWHKNVQAACYRFYTYVPDNFNYKL